MERQDLKPQPQHALPHLPSLAATQRGFLIVQCKPSRRASSGRYTLRDLHAPTVARRYGRPLRLTRYPDLPCS
jgi:hypothetical protein